MQCSCYTLPRRAPRVHCMRHEARRTVEREPSGARRAARRATRRATEALRR